jgi:hypothetical protein
MAYGRERKQNFDTPNQHRELVWKMKKRVKFLFWFKTDIVFPGYRRFSSFRQPIPNVILYR